MHTNPKTKSMESGWKVLIVTVIGGYAMGSALTYQVSASQTQPIIFKNPSLQQEIETNVAGLAEGIWNQLVKFMQDGMPKTEIALPSVTIASGINTMLATTPRQETANTQIMQNNDKNSNKNQNSEPVFPIVYNILPASESSILPMFSDIQDDSNRQNIEILSSIGLFQGGKGGKFYPHNHVLMSDFIRVILDLYRYKLGYSSDNQNGYVNIPHFDPKLNPELLKKLNTAHALGLLDGLGEITLDKPITPKQALQIINNTLNLSPTLGSKEIKNQISPSGETLTKSQMSAMLVAVFQLEKSTVNPFFNDIGNHRYQEAINRLAQLGVVAGRNGNFYPDAKALREDGIIMITNGLLASKRQALVINTFTHLNSINDTTYFAAFAPHLEYLLAHEIGDFLLHPQSTGYVFTPHAQLTKGEAYTLLSQAARIKLLNMDPGIASQPITRGELAELIVESFDFQPIQAKKTSIPTPVPDLSVQTNQYIALRNEKKGVLISFLKDILETI